jgi:hypothetical protein
MAIRDDQRSDSEKDMFALWGRFHCAFDIMQNIADQLAGNIAKLEANPDYPGTASAKQISKIGRVKTWLNNFSVPVAFRDTNAD